MILFLSRKLCAKRLPFFVDAFWLTAILCEEMLQQLRTVDLFAGSGGLSLGFQNAGFDVVAAYDSWSAAIDCYKLNFKHPIFHQDLSRVDEISEKVKALKAGHHHPSAEPPCPRIFLRLAKEVKAQGQA